MKIFTTAFIFSSLLSANCIAQGVWTQKTSVPDSVRIEAGGFDINGKGYLMCGRHGTNYFKTIWEYNPANDSWTQKANLSGTARRETVCFSIGTKGYPFLLEEVYFHDLEYVN